jgi:hypothetical protein
MAAFCGELTAPWPVLFGMPFYFSADSAHFAYLLMRGETKDIAIVVDGKVCAADDNVPAGPVFRADGTLEFIAQKGDGLFRVRVTGY